jgi:hypothetical protein
MDWFDILFDAPRLLTEGSPRFIVSFLESGLTFVSTVKPDSRKDTKNRASLADRYSS